MGASPQAASAPLPPGPRSALRTAQLLELRGQHDAATAHYTQALSQLSDQHGDQHPLVESARGSYRVLQAKQRAR